MSLFAFGFAEPLWFLGWLALGGLPVVIHLLNRRRYRETQWAAMRFLMEAVRKNSRRVQLQQLLILLLRVMIVCLLVLALARPFLEQVGTLFAADAPIHRILIIDTSFSMAFEPGEQSRFELAQEAARRIVEESRPGDAFNLVRISGSEPRVIVGKPSFQPAEMTQEIDRLTLPHEVGNVPAALSAAVKLLSAADVSRKEVYLISDFQRISWIPDAAGQMAEIRSSLNQLGDRARLIVIDLGQPQTRNSAVTDFRATEPFVTVGRPARFKAAATTFGSAPLNDQTLEFYVDGKLQGQQTIDLQPAVETAVDFQFNFPAPRDYRMQVRLAADPLAIDDRRWLTVPVRDKIKILCVNGRLAGRPSETATYHLEIALAPSSEAFGAGSLSLVAPQVIKYGDLRGSDLAEYDAVFLCDISAFTAAEAQILESYLQSGGGVVWCLGERVRPDDYNRILYRDGKGILPAKIGAPRGDAVQRKEGFAFDPLQFAHPIVNPFQGNPDAGLESTRIYRYFQTELPPGGQSRVALGFDTGDAAIIESRVESGRALLVTTPVDATWGNWGLWPSFVPMIQEMVLYAVAGRAGERQLIAGETLLRAAQTRGADVRATVLRPDEATAVMEVHRGANVSEFAYEQTDISGVYQIEFGAPLGRKELFAVNIDPRESNLAKLDQDELERDLLAGTDFLYRTNTEDLDRGAARPLAGERGGMSRWFLYAVLYLLFVEQMMAWNFTYGLWLLFPPLGLAKLLMDRARGRTVSFR